MSTTVDIAGKSYKFDTPSNGIMLSAYLKMKRTPDDSKQGEIMLVAMVDWLAAGVGEKRWADVELRMDRGEISAEDISESFKTAMEEVTGRPFSSSPESSHRPSKKRSGGKQSRRGSTCRN